MDFSTPIDESLLAALRRGCRNSQERVYRCYSRPAWTLALRLCGCEATAWDAVQGGFVLAFERIGQLDHADRFGAWLRRIVVNQVMDAGRRALPALPPESPECEDPAKPEDALDLLRALGRLERLDRAVLWLHDAEGMTHGEIAAVLQQSVPWSKTRLSRARGKIRAYLHAAPLQLLRSDRHAC